MTDRKAFHPQTFDETSLAGGALPAWRGKTVSSLASRYWRLREQQERAAAAAVQCDSTRAVHAAMAERYAQFAERTEKFATSEDHSSGLAHV